MILSVDVGSVNMGIVLLKKVLGKYELVDLRVLRCTTIKKATIARACSDMFETLEEAIGSLDIKEALIEQQPPRNTKTKVLSHCLQIYLLTKGVRCIRFCSPRNKLPGPKLRTYAERKKKAVALASRYLIPTVFYTKFCAMEKKDDVADALLQAVHVYGIKDFITVI